MLYPRDDWKKCNAEFQPLISVFLSSGCIVDPIILPHSSACFGRQTFARLLVSSKQDECYSAQVCSSVVKGAWKMDVCPSFSKQVRMMGVVNFAPMVVQPKIQFNVFKEGGVVRLMFVSSKRNATPPKAA